MFFFNTLEGSQFINYYKEKSKRMFGFIVTNLAQCYYVTNSNRFLSNETNERHVYTVCFAHFKKCNTVQKPLTFPLLLQ